MEDRNLKTLVTEACAEMLVENLCDKETEEYNSTVGVRQGTYEDEGLTIFIIANTDTGKFWELKVDNNDWFDIERAKKDKDYEGENIEFVLQMYLREVVFKLIKEKTNYER